MEMPFLRSRYDQRTGLSPNNPRQQLNEISAWLDGGLTYGPNKAWADALRTFKDGLLASMNDTDEDEWYVPARNDIKLPMANPPPPLHHELKPINRFYRLGNPRGNENPFLLTFGILWFRYHNLKARQFKEQNSDWSDERLFNEARKWTIAVHQKIVVYDWLPAWLGETALPEYKYNPGLNPGIMHVFQSAAMRFGHTLVVPGVYIQFANGSRSLPEELTVGDNGHIKALRTCNTYWVGTDIITKSTGIDIDDLLRGMGNQLAEGEDMIITPDLRGDVFGPLEFSRRDLMAINIQRGRDHGLPDYNTARKEFGLDPIEEFSEINPALYAADPTLFERLSKLYNGSVDNLDIWPAGMLETRGQYLSVGENPGPGPLFSAIILDQFTRIRNGDRFWYENRKINGLFTEEEIEEINNISLLDVILAVTDIKREQFQNRTNIFFNHRSDALKVDATQMANCTQVKHFDYFSGSEISFALSFAALILWIFVCIGLLLLCAKLHEREVAKEIKRNKGGSRKMSDVKKHLCASEWVGNEEGSRNVRIKFNDNKKLILIQSERGRPLRTIDLTQLEKSTGDKSVQIILSADKHMRTMCIRIPKEYDLVFKFDNVHERDSFLDDLRRFLSTMGMTVDSPRSLSERVIHKQAVTKKNRKEQLELFFRAVFTRALDYEVGEPMEDMQRGHVQEDIFNCELTKYEFADALSLKPNSLFVENMFQLVDKDENGYISFREFLDIIVIFHKGSAEDKARMLFDMYDLNRTGNLTRDAFKTMLKSLMELANAELEEDKVNHLLDQMYKSAGLERKNEISFGDFQNILGDYKSELSYAFLDVEMSGEKAPRANAPSRARKTVYKGYSDGGATNTFQAKRQKRMSHLNDGIKTIQKEYPRGPLAQKFNELLRYFENNRLQIFWRTLYTLVTIGIFVERAYYYSTEREHVGLRRIAGYGVTVTRGAASGMMFTYSCLLVTMCRNTITFLRETFLHRFIPFDDAIEMHKYIAVLAMIFTLMHCIGHAINFYHVSTQTADDLSCLFRDFFHATDDLPKFHRWCWETITGFTGVLLTLLVFLMYTFAIQYARRNAFRWFWFTHNMYVLLFLLMLLHGAGRLVQAPFTYYFLLGPVILFTLDKLISVTRNNVKIAVMRAELLPSDVTYIEFKRPGGFEYKSGQWVRIACIAQGAGEYHPFTLTSAPHEENLCLHIRAVGPWTMNLRRTYDPNVLRELALPKIYLDGPYGEGHQDWYRYDVSVLVGGGIGVTPFASILKDIAHRSATGAKINCKKVYFLWVTRTQKHFEWMTDIIREVEEKDTSDIVSVHIFVTQFKQKFDIRTTMLYICERHFQKICNRSLFTGLNSITHFGRPDFHSFFQLLLSEHADTNLFGVFSCGPPPMTHNVEKACSDINKYTTNTLFVHHYENF